MNFSPVLSSLRDMLKGLLAAVPNIVVALIVFSVFYLVARGIRLLVERITIERRRARNLGLVLGRLAQGGIVLFGLFIALIIIFPSFKIGDLIQLLGISGVAIGFAFRDILQNFLAGILLLLTQPFHIGDQIITKSFEGTVADIQTRATTIMTYDGRRIVIPNANLFTEAVTVNTALDTRRLEYDIEIDYDNNLTQTKQYILQAVSGVQDILKEPAPDALVVDITPNGVIIRVRWWIKPPRRADALDTQDKVLLALKQTFIEHNINLPIQKQRVLLHQLVNDGEE